MNSITLFLPGRGLTVIKYDQIVHDEITNLRGYDVLGNEVGFTSEQLEYIFKSLL